MRNICVDWLVEAVQDLPTTEGLSDAEERGSPPNLLIMEVETFGQPVRRGPETSTEHRFNWNGGKPGKINCSGDVHDSPNAESIWFDTLFSSSKPPPLTSAANHPWKLISRSALRTSA